MSRSHYLLTPSSKDICNLIGLSENKICKILERYDYILPYESNLKVLDTNSIYEDWVKNIPGVHVNDLILLEEFFKNNYSNEYSDFSNYLNSSNKRMYQIIITKPEFFSKYCKWLFNILFSIEKEIDSHLYTNNGKRTIWYLAEILYGYYFRKISRLKIYECGILFLD